MPSHRPPGRAANSRDRRIAGLEQRRKILIVCEGELTEPNYFASIISIYKLNTVTLRDGSGIHVDIDPASGVALSLVNHAAKRQPTSKEERYEEIWCVFDLDQNPPDSFDNAIHKADKTPFLRAAWSNESFELWYVLHFQSLVSSPARDHGKNRGGKVRDYYTETLDKLMKEHVGCEQYEKNDPDMFGKLGPKRLELAIKRAEKLLNEWTDNDPYHKRQPATTVHLLVKRLLEFAPGSSQRFTQLGNG